MRYPKPLLPHTTHGMRNQIELQPDFQRPSVWSTPQKQLLVDTILRDYDIPKLYWRQTSTRPEKYEVIDGQQRLTAIWEFMDGKFKLPKNADPIENEAIAKLGYSDLPSTLKIKFDGYQLDVIVVSELEDDEVREMFLRLQNGTSLKAQEKRNAFPGKMRDFIKSLVEKHSFFKSLGFRNVRFTHDLVAAQFVCLELAGGPTNIRKPSLDKMYRNHTDFDENSKQAKRVKRLLKILHGIFPKQIPELEHHSVITLYCVVSKLLEEYAFDEVNNFIHDWFIEFEKSRHAEESKSEDDADTDWLTYKERTGHSTDAEDSIDYRVNFMLRHLLERHPDLPLKDGQKEFTEVQRKIIFRKDNGHCQIRLKCDGKDQLPWGNWHCDHIKPWSKGGPTTVSNGQVSCAACNLSKGSDG